MEPTVTNTLRQLTQTQMQLQAIDGLSFHSDEWHAASPVLRRERSDKGCQSFAIEVVPGVRQSTPECGGG